MSINYAEVPGWVQWLIALTVVVAALAAVVGLLRKAWPLLTKLVATMNNLEELPGFMERTSATLADQDRKIAEIHHETHDNSGSSLKDAGARTERNLTALTKTVKGIDEGVRGIYDRLDTLEQMGPRAPRENEEDQ